MRIAVNNWGVHLVSTPVIHYILIVFFFFVSYVQAHVGNRVNSSQFIRTLMTTILDVTVGMFNIYLHACLFYFLTLSLL